MPSSDPELARAIASAREAWPEIELDEERFAAFLAERVSKYEASRVADLALAFACLQGDTLARETFRLEYAPVIRSGLQRLDASEEELADIEQAVWERVLVGSPSAPAKLASYDGGGPLLHWLRVVMVRVRADVLRRRARAPAVESRDGSKVADAIDDPEFAYLKAHYRQLLRVAFESAFETLEPRLRTALRLHVLDGLSTEQIGRVHGVHAATARRWLAKARVDLLEAARASIAEQGGVEPSDFESVVRLVRSQLDLSLRRALGS